MHGEYKPPGGKLVAADVEVAGGLLARAGHCGPTAGLVTAGDLRAARDAAREKFSLSRWTARLP